MTKHKGTSVCFTGHRTIKFGSYDENSNLIRWIKSKIEIEIQKAISLGYTTFISGMAVGVDQWAAEIVIKLKKDDPDLKLVCAVPFKGQERQWPHHVQQRYWVIKDEADEIIEVSEQGYTPRKMQIRNEWMVNNSSIVIAVWDGSAGGTGNCVKYAKKAKTELWIIDPNQHK